MKGSDMAMTEKQIRAYQRGAAPAFRGFQEHSVAPAIQRCVIQINATLFHHLFQIAIADAVFAITTHGPKDKLAYQMPQLNHHSSCLPLTPT